MIIAHVILIIINAYQAVQIACVKKEEIDFIFYLCMSPELINFRTSARYLDKTLVKME